MATELFGYVFATYDETIEESIEYYTERLKFWKAEKRRRERERKKRSRLAELETTHAKP